MTDELAAEDMYFIGPESFFEVSKHRFKKELKDWAAKENGIPLEENKQTIRTNTSEEIYELLAK